MRRPFSLRTASAFLVSFAVAAILHAGGAWVPIPGNGNLTLGYSRKHAASSFNGDGDHVNNASQHDFRYAYLQGDVGILKNLSGQFLLTWLDGYQFLGGEWPMAVGASLPTPFLYDREGPYNRYTFDSTGRISGLSDFNLASMGRLGAGLIVPFGPHRMWNVELGYNKWVWGRSARRYNEPYISLSRNF